MHLAHILWDIASVSTPFRCWHTHGPLSRQADLFKMLPGVSTATPPIVWSLLCFVFNPHKNQPHKTDKTVRLRIKPINECIKMLIWKLAEHTTRRLFGVVLTSKRSRWLCACQCMKYCKCLSVCDDVKTYQKHREKR